MKNTIKWLIALLSFGVLLVIILMTIKPFENKDVDQSTFHEFASNITKTVSKDDKESKQSDKLEKKDTSKISIGDVGESKNSTSEQGADSQNSTSEQDSGQKIQTDTAETISSVSMESLVNGDYSSLIGTWENVNGESITITSEGKVIDNRNTRITYSLGSGRIQEGRFHTAMYNPESEYDSAAFIVLPAGVPTPHLGAPVGEDAIAIGQDENAYYNAYFRK